MSKSYETGNRELAESRSFDAEFAQKQREIQEGIVQSGRGFSEKMAGLMTMQNDEILRLRKVIADNTLIPERRPVHLAISSVVVSHSVSHNLLAIANDGSPWLMQGYNPEESEEYHVWHRLPPLPQAMDEAAEK